ncbi:MAG: sigma-70 family RNA polymerase sigma factor [Acidimicrobiales bacterium]|nr:sigma-70 family RNA polymerase sigma factor [Acidimicrobiales bacterium]MBO0894404.1 sigma-70 family RNA polymerase sigma factor [Acidimicrobiales bacterium]
MPAPMTVRGRGPTLPRRGARRRADQERLDRDQLVESHLGLAHALARRYADRGESTADLVQVASVGLVKAARRFDPERGILFSTYATASVLGELKRHFRSTRWKVHMPRRLQELALEVRDTEDSLTNRLRRTPTPAEIAETVRISEKEVDDAIQARSTFSMLPLNGPSAYETHDNGPKGRDVEDPTPMLERVEQRDFVRYLLDRLPDRERKVVELRFDDQLTQDQIGARLNMSQMQVSRLLSRSLGRLRVLAEAS